MNETMSETVPRRARIDLNTPAELAIRAAVDAVELAGAHPELTGVVVDLGRARERLADFVDGAGLRRNLTFGEALEVLKTGRRVARAGWNGKGIWLAYTPGSTIPAEYARSGAVKAQVEAEGVAEVRIRPHIDMRAADGSIVIGWLASQTDMLAQDWAVLA